MTVAAVYHLPGQGAVFACDSRITMGTTILSDSCDKWLLCGSVTLVVAGADGGLTLALARCRDIQQVIRVADEYSTPRDVDWIALGYDQKSDRIFTLLSCGQLQPLTRYSTIGCGGSYAKGWLDSCALRRDLRSAERVLRDACQSAIANDAACGGLVRTVTHKINGQVRVK